MLERVEKLVFPDPSPVDTFVALSMCVVLPLALTGIIGFWFFIIYAAVSGTAPIWWKKKKK